MFRKAVLIFTVCLTLFWLGASGAEAASLFFSPGSKQLNVGDTVNVKVLVNTQSQAINNAEAIISFPNDLLEVVSTSKSGSIFSLWVEEPTFSNDNGVVNFNGGVPTPGYSGSGGTIINITFRAKSQGTATVYVSSGSVLANDGQGTDVYSGQSSAQIIIAGQTPTPPSQSNPPTNNQSTNLGPVTISSPTHPDSTKWYNASTAIFNWQLPSGSQSSQTSLDANQNQAPRITRKPAISTITVQDPQDGVLYFHARFLTSQGWTAVSTYKIQEDATPPYNLQINAQPQADGSVIPVVSAQDALSGIDYFTVQSDGGETVKIPATNNSAQITDLPSGTHQLIVMAYDKAGNTVTATASLETKQQSKLSITNYTSPITEGDRIVASGKGPSSQEIILSLAGPGDPVRSYTVNTDLEGDFSFQSELIAGAGTYDFWAQTKEVNPAVSKHVQIIVKPSLATRIWNIYINIIGRLTPLNVFVTIILILMLLGWNKYFSLRKTLSGRGGKVSADKLLQMLEEESKKQKTIFEAMAAKKEISADELAELKKLQTEIQNILEKH